jgi:tetratricopeptide (TPR) repeat protein
MKTTNNHYFCRGTDYDKAIEIDPDNAGSWNSLCWNGSLWEHAAEVLDACEQAVSLEPEKGRIRNSRRLARALTGDYAGAVEDFEAFVEWASDYSFYEEDVEQRKAWIATLQGGENPFTEEVLQELREE